MASETAIVTISTTINTSSEGGGSHVTTITKTGNSLERTGPSIPAAKTGRLTTRTDNDTGVITLDAGHGLTTGVGDVFWAGGTRRGMTWTIVTNALTIDGGSGDALPADETDVTVMKFTEVPFTVDGDDVVVLAASAKALGSGKEGWIVFVDDADAVIAAATFRVGPTTAEQWCSDIGTVNPLAGKITSVVRFSHGDITARVMRAAAIHN